MGNEIGELVEPILERSPETWLTYGLSYEEERDEILDDVFFETTLSKLPIRSLIIEVGTDTFDEKYRGAVGKDRYGIKGLSLDQKSRVRQATSILYRI